MLDKKDSREKKEESLNSAMEHFKHMTDEDKEDMLDWLEHIWLNHIPDEKKNELLEKFERGEVLGMNSGLSLLFEEERLKAEKKGEKKGEKIGEKKGEKKKAIDTAKKMIAKNKPIDEIIEFTGLTEEEIKGLK